MHFVLEEIPLVEPTVVTHYENKVKCVAAFLTAVRKVKRKRLWGVRLKLIYPSGSDYWLVADAYQEPLKARGLNDIPATKELLPYLRRKTKRRY